MFIAYLGKGKLKTEYSFRLCTNSYKFREMYNFLS